jgi:hypothetical protein
MPGKSRPGNPYRFLESEFWSLYFGSFTTKTSGLDSGHLQFLSVKYKDDCCQDRTKRTDVLQTIQFGGDYFRFVGFFDAKREKDVTTIDNGFPDCENIQRCQSRQSGSLNSKG